MIEFIKSCNSILITTHFKPDGDGIASSLAAFKFLSILYKEKKIEIVIDGICPDNIQFLKDSNKILSKPTLDEYDLVIVLDCNNLDRLGYVKEFVKKSKIICIDHHQNSSYFDYNFINTEVSSTSELLYSFLKKFNEFNEIFNKDIAECIYTGIVSDTGNFSWNLYPDTFQIATALLKIGVDYNNIIENLNKKSLSGFKILSDALKNIIKTDKMVYSFLHDKDIINKNDSEGIIDFIKNLDCYKVFLLFKIYDNKLKCSVRTKNNKALEIALLFKGGGHINAAAFETNQSLVNVIKEIERIL